MKMVKNLLPWLVGGKAAVVAAMENEKSIHYGVAVGLTESEAREVIAAWRNSPWFNWHTVRSMMNLRAGGLNWRP